jgi:hypothetical protein
MVMGAFIFEFFTGPMWLNYHLGTWGYVYHGVSLILTMGLASMALAAVVLVDHYLPKLREGYRYLISILALWPVMVLVEKLVIHLGIRGYAPETLNAFNSTMVPYIGMSWLAALYLPLLFCLIIAFYKYFAFAVDKTPLVPINKTKIIRNFIYTSIGVFLFELLVGAMVDNTNFPSWSYVWHDLTIILTTGWTIVIVFSSWFIEKFYMHKSIYARFIYTVVLGTIIIAPFESWLMHAGYRVYLPSTVANFSGFVAPWINVPVEVIFAVPFYLMLALTFSRYWEIVSDNKL